MRRHVLWARVRSLITASISDTCHGGAQPSGASSCPAQAYRPLVQPAGIAALSSQSGRSREKVSDPMKTAALAFVFAVGSVLSLAPMAAHAEPPVIVARCIRGDQAV